MTRVWLVDRDVDSRNLVTMTYATPDGSRQYVRQMQLDSLARRDGPTAALDVEEEELEPVEDETDRERYAAEADRMAERHDPDDAV